MGYKKWITLQSTSNIYCFRAVWLLRNVGRCWKRNKNKNYRRTLPSIFLQIQSKKQKNINATTLLSRFYSPAVPVCSRPPCWSRGPRNWSQSSSSVNRSARSPTVRAEFSVSRDPVLCLVKKWKKKNEKKKKKKKKAFTVMRSLEWRTVISVCRDWSEHSIEALSENC